MKAKLVVACIVFALTIGSGWWVYSQVTSAKQFRTSPRLGAFNELMSSSNLLNGLTKHLVLQEGSRSYNQSIVGFMTRIRVRPMLLNSLVLSSWLESLSDAEIVTLGWTFTDDPSLLAPSLQARFLSRCSFESVMKERISIGVDSRFIENAGLRDAAFSCLRDKFSVNDDANLPLWIIPATFGPDVEELLTEDNVALLSIIQTQPTPVGRVAADYLRSLDYLDWHAINTIVNAESSQPELVLHLFKQQVGLAVGSEDDSDISRQAQELFRHLILFDKHPFAQLAVNWIQSIDNSRVKKNVVVIAARNPHYVELPPGLVDEAFVRGDRRTESFRSVTDYLNSDTAKEYVRLARHDYLETGKSFPAAYCLPPLDDELAEWQSFLEDYPDFPGADDAHYRVMSRLYLDGRYGDALTELGKLRAANYIDFDVESMLNQADLMIRAALIDPPLGLTAESWYLHTKSRFCGD